MDLFGSEGLHLFLRWFHLVAVITWIGHAYFFNWLDRGLRPVGARRDGEEIEGELWMVHSGGFYRVEKISVAPERMPAELHWFKWEAALSWISGFLLLLVTYHHGGALLLDPGSALSTGQASALGLGALVVGWFVYDALWASGFGRWKLAPVVGWALLAGVAFVLDHSLSGRAAWVHVGSLLGTIMVANVWRRIIPAQTQLLAATAAGTARDAGLAKAAKGRSIHNNYLSLPVVLIMISNHFWGLYGHSQGWLVLMLLALGGVALRHMLNQRLSKQPFSPALALAVLASVLAAGWVLAPTDDGDDDARPVGDAAPVRPAVPGRGGSGPASDLLTDLLAKPLVIKPASDASATTSGANPTGAATAHSGWPVRDDDPPEELPEPPVSSAGKQAPGAIAGVIRFHGTPPAPQPLSLTADCAGFDPGHLTRGDVLLRDGLVANVFVRLTDGVDRDRVPPVPAAPVDLDQRGCIFEPRVLGLRVGQSLRLINSDPVLHNVHSKPKINREFNIGFPGGAWPTERSFKKAEVMVPITCDVHPWMTSWVGVVDHPWFAVTDESGAFLLEHVPPGRYALEAWHEVFGALDAEVEVLAGQRAVVDLEWGGK